MPKAKVNKIKTESIVAVSSDSDVDNKKADSSDSDSNNKDKAFSPELPKEPSVTSSSSSGESDTEEKEILKRKNKKQLRLEKERMKRERLQKLNAMSEKKTGKKHVSSEPSSQDHATLQRLKLEQNPITSGKLFGLGKIPKKAKTSNSTSPNMERKSIVDDGRSGHKSNHSSFNKNLHRSVSSSDDPLKSSYSKKHVDKHSEKKSPLSLLMTSISHKPPPNSSPAHKPEVKPPNKSSSEVKQLPKPATDRDQHKPASEVKDLIKLGEPKPPPVKRSSPEPASDVAAKKSKLSSSEGSPSTTLARQNSTDASDKSKDKDKHLKHKSKSFIIFPGTSRLSYNMLYL